MNASTQAPNQGIDSQYPDDEIDLRELWLTIWSRKFQIILITLVVMVIALVYALMQDNYYKAQVVLAPAQSEGQSGLASKFGGLASLAGVSLGGGGGGGTQIALATLQSRQFGERFITENNLKPVLFADNWDADTQTWIVEPPGLLASIKSTILPAGEEVEKGYQREELAPGEPSLWEAYEAFQSMLSVSTNKDTGLVTFGVEFTDPVLAAKWSMQLIGDLNQLMKAQQLEEAKKSNAYLAEQLKKTSIADVRQSIYQMMQSNIKTMTLANISDDVVFKVIDPAVVPEEKSKPKRALIMAVATVLGGMLGIFWALVANAIRPKTPTKSA